MLCFRSVLGPIGKSNLRGFIRFPNPLGVRSVLTFFFVEPSVSGISGRNVSGLEPWLESLLHLRPWVGFALGDPFLQRCDFAAPRWSLAIFGAGWNSTESPPQSLGICLYIYLNRVLPFTYLMKIGLKLSGEAPLLDTEFPPHRFDRRK